MATFSKFTKVSVISNLSLEEAGALLHCLNYTIAKCGDGEGSTVLGHLVAIRTAMLTAGVKVDGKGS